MRLRSVWERTCAACDKAIVTETAEGTCPHCGVEYRIDGWQGEDGEPRP
jgi:predicted RNA-binding Zn-ribbon protein involved in translation (DUF1610 family)